MAFLNSWPSYSQEEIEEVASVLKSGKVNYWTGNQCRLFEKEFSQFCGANYAVALSNGTVALELGLLSLGIGPGDEVIVTSRTFLASVSAVVVIGATPIFADIDPESQNITEEAIFSVLTSKTKAIITVHLAGWPCDMERIVPLAKKFHLKIIEDCSQAHGALYNNVSVGSIGDVAAWSFCQDKIMTTGGEGGMLTTNDPLINEFAWSYKDHGKSWDAVYNSKHPPGFRWLHQRWGTNWRMTEVQAAIGRIQIRKMENWTRLRAKNAEKIISVGKEFSNIVRSPSPPDFIQHGWYKCYLFVRDENLPNRWSRDQILKEINSLGVPCYTGSCSEVYLEKVFDGTKFRPKQRLPVAKKLGETSLTFLVHPTLSNEEIDKTCSVINDVFTTASKC